VSIQKISASKKQGASSAEWESRYKCLKKTKPNDVKYILCCSNHPANYNCRVYKELHKNIPSTKGKDNKFSSSVISIVQSKSNLNTYSCVQAVKVAKTSSPQNNIKQNNTQTLKAIQEE